LVVVLWEVRECCTNAHLAMEEVVVMVLFYVLEVTGVRRWVLGCGGWGWGCVVVLVSWCFVVVVAWGCVEGGGAVASRTMCEAVGGWW